MQSMFSGKMVVLCVQFKEQVHIFGAKIKYFCINLDVIVMKKRIQVYSIKSCLIKQQNIILISL